MGYTTSIMHRARSPIFFATPAAARYVSLAMKPILSLSCLVAAFFLTITAIRADQVEMRNGDRYVGKVVTLDANTLILKNDNLGTVRIARTKVANLTFGDNVANPVTPAPAPAAAVTNPPPAPAMITTNGQADLSASLKALGANTNFINQVRSQFLAGAGPEANNKFNEMVSGLMSGKMDINALRSQAQKSANDLRKMKREVGDDTGILDSYLSILDGFIQESAPTTNAPPPQAQNK
jgi:hypothetical protein